MTNNSEACYTDFPKADKMLDCGRLSSNSEKERK